MARGWESKDIETQQELAEQRRAQKSTAETPEARERRLKIESLELTRARVQHDLERARHPRHRAQLEAALAHLHDEITKLTT
jgi:hypothetical protein